MHRLPHIEFKVRVGPRHALPTVHPDRGHQLEFLVGVQKVTRFGQQPVVAAVGGRAGLLAGIARVVDGRVLHPRRPRRVVDPEPRGGGAAVNVPALALAEGAAPQQLPEDGSRHLTHPLVGRRART